MEQVPKELYEFQDCPMTEVEAGAFAEGQQVQDYIERFAREFNLMQHIQLNTAVDSMAQQPDGSWVLTTSAATSQGSATDGAGEAGARSGSGAPQTHKFDFLVVATGLYSGRECNMPHIPGRFDGDVMHTNAFRDASIAQGKRVLVVGGAKSAIDCAVEARRAGASAVTLLQRAAHWPTPRKIAGLIPFQYVFLSRLGTALVSAHRGCFPGGSGIAVSVFRTLGWPVVAGAFYVVEALFALQLGLTGDRRPKTDVVSDFYGCGFEKLFSVFRLIGNPCSRQHLSKGARCCSEFRCYDESLEDNATL